MTTQTKHSNYQNGLRRPALEQGLLDQRFSNYYGLISIIVALGISAYRFTALRNRWRYLAIPLWAMFWMQVGLVGHDAGHDAVFKNTKHNLRLGFLMFTTILGMAFRPWKIRHNKHHASPNVEDEDEDLENKVVCYLKHKAALTTGLRRIIVRYQAPLFPFLTMFATIGFRIDAWRYALGIGQMPFNDTLKRSKFEGERKLELGLLTVNALLWLVIPAKIFGFKRWYSILIPAQGLFGVYMAHVFAPNHKGMAVFTRDNMPGHDRLQIETAGNVSPNWFTNWIYGGLNLQIEHHLFPTMPRCHQMKARELTRAYCRRMNIPYTEESLIESLRRVYGSLAEAAEGAKGKAAA